ncbi:uncharacterized protein A4U43_C08F30950 [Asparagus officinalis]|nr:uncharacterized protein A4U43_C08F30950 [Asparagus officinalis]
MTSQDEKRRKLRKISDYEPRRSIEAETKVIHVDDSGGAVLASHDKEILGEVSDVNLHLSIRRYLVHGSLMEKEIFGQIEQVRASYLKLQEESTTQKTDLENTFQSLLTKENELVDFHREMEVRESMMDSLKASDSQKSADINKLKHKLYKRKKRKKNLSEEV